MGKINSSKYEQENRMLKGKIASLQVDNENQKGRIEDQQKRLDMLVSNYEKKLDERQREIDRLTGELEAYRSRPKMGRKPIPDDKKEKIVAMRRQGASYRLIADAVGLGLATVYKAVNGKGTVE